MDRLERERLTFEKLSLVDLYRLADIEGEKLSKVKHPPMVREIERKIVAIESDINAKYASAMRG